MVLNWLSVDQRVRPIDDAAMTIFWTRASAGRSSRCKSSPKRGPSLAFGTEGYLLCSECVSSALTFVGDAEGGQPMTVLKPLNMVVVGAAFIFLGAIVVGVF